MKCPSDKPCPFKKFSLEKGMECVRDEYPHLIIACLEAEMKYFVEAAKKR